MPCLTSIFLHQLIPTPIPFCHQIFKAVNTLKLSHVNPPLSTPPHLMHCKLVATFLYCQAFWKQSFNPCTSLPFSTIQWLPVICYLFPSFHWSYCLSTFLTDDPPCPPPGPCSVHGPGCCLFIIWCVDNLLATFFGFRNTTLLAVFLPLPHCLFFCPLCLDTTLLKQWCVDSLSGRLFNHWVKMLSNKYRLEYNILLS